MITNVSTMYHLLPFPSNVRFFLFGFEDFHEGALGDVHFADFFHSLFPLFLLFPELALAGDVAAVTFCGDVLGDGADGFAGDDLAANGCLDRDFKELLRNHFFEFGADGAPFGLRFGAVDETGKGVDRFFIDADFEFDDIALCIVVWLIVERGIAAGDRFEFVVEVGDDLIHGEAIGEEKAGGAHGFRFEELAPLIHAKAHDAAEIFRGGHDVDFDPGLFDKIDVGGIGSSERDCRFVVFRRC